MDDGVVVGSLIAFEVVVLAIILGLVFTVSSLGRIMAREFTDYVVNTAVSSEAVDIRALTDHQGPLSVASIRAVWEKNRWNGSMRNIRNIAGFAFNMQDPAQRAILDRWFSDNYHRKVNYRLVEVVGAPGIFDIQIMEVIS
jgi:hypothetical protein